MALVPEQFVYADAVMVLVPLIDTQMLTFFAVGSRVEPDKSQSDTWKSPTVALPKGAPVAMFP